MSKNTTVTPSSTHNVIAIGTKVIGQVMAEEDIRIDGSIEGNVSCKGKIIIGPSSIVTGDLECQNIELMGKIIGNLTCSEKITLRNKSQLVGDIKTQTIEIEPGAVFSGACSMNTASTK